MTILEHLWDNGKCRTVDTGVFYPDVGHDAKAAKALCRECPVLSVCREYSVIAEAHGVWGGLTERERRRERRKRMLPEPGAVIGVIPYNVVAVLTYGQVEVTV